MKRILYLGLDPTRYPVEGNLVHFPMIETVARPFQGDVKIFFDNLPLATHVIVTSRTVATLFCEYAEKAGADFKKKVFLAIGEATGEILQQKGIHSQIASEHTGEGIVELLSKTLSPSYHIYYPHSAIARSIIKNYLETHRIPFTSLALYDTYPRSIPLPDLDQFDQIVFTSPSTVHAFFASTQKIPPYTKCIAIGPITQQAIEEKFF
jgi:uroporphyrinogen-III synthase